MRRKINREKEGKRKLEERSGKEHEQSKSGKGSLLIFKRAFFLIAFISVSFGVISAIGETGGGGETKTQVKEGSKEKSFDFWKAVFSYIPFPEKPPQPIKFPHSRHVKDLGIDCEFCHYYARKSKYAGVPAVEVCIGCHKYVAKVRQRPEIKKLFKYWEEGKPIPWVKVHDLPDFVRFTHRMHLNAGLECSECHGDVASMDTAERVAPLTMGWCLDCHRKKGASTECFACHY